VKPKVIKVAKVSGNRNTRHDTLRTLATLCYYYPAYTLQMARQIPHIHVLIMISQARRLEAKKNFDLTQIVAAPHTKKGGGVKKLADNFKGITKNG